MAIKRSIIPEVGVEDSYEIVHRHLPVDQPPSSFTYIVAKLNGGYVVKNGKTGVIELIEQDPNQANKAIQWAINALSKTKKVEESFTVPAYSQWESFDAAAAVWSGVVAGDTLSNDTVDKVEGVASLSVVTGGGYGGARRTGLDLDWSAYDTIILWGKGVEAAWTDIRLTIKDTIGNWERFNDLCAARDTWYRYVYNLRDYNERSGVVDWTHIAEVELVYMTGVGGRTIKFDNFWLAKRIKLSQDYLVYGSETIPGLTRDVDYIIDYGTGEILPLPGGNMVSGSSYTISYQHYLPGGRIQIGEGDFLLSDIVKVTCSRIALIGAGMGITCLKYIGPIDESWTDGKGGVISIQEGIGAITISDMEVEAGDRRSYALETAAVFPVHSNQDILIERVHAKNGGDDSISISGKPLNVWVRNCRITREKGTFAGRTYSGIEIERGSSNVWVINNIIDSGRFTADFAPIRLHLHVGYPFPHSVRVATNRFYPWRGGTPVDWSRGDITISDNW